MFVRRTKTVKKSTLNYDGKNKSITRRGDETFSMLVGNREKLIFDHFFRYVFFLNFQSYFDLFTLRKSQYSYDVLKYGRVLRGLFIAIEIVQKPKF